MSQKNVNKFLAGAVTATMVATAVVTPAMAASFTDTGKLPEQIKGEVERAVELGYFQDSEKFNPAASITRGQVALVIARQVSGVAANDIAGLKAYVAKHGLEEKVTPFADVKKGETELYYASLIVKNAGAFTQDSLNPASNITRSQMAKVVVTSFGLELDKDNQKEITDISKVSNKEYIEILASNGVTEPQNGKFNPGNNVTRSQMASFLVRAHDGVKEEVKEVKVESVKAINTKTIEVKFDKPVDVDKAKFTVKKGDTTVNVEQSSFNADKTVAYLELNAKISAGTYTVSVTGLTEDALTSSFEAQDEKVASIKFLSENLVLSTKITDVKAETTATAAYQVLNQYGEDITKSSLANGFEFRTAVGEIVGGKSGKGIITIDNLNKNGHQPRLGDSVVVTIVDTDSGQSASEVLKIVDEAKVSEITFGEVVSSKKSELTEDTVDHGTYYLPFEAKDQYGAEFANEDKIAEDVMVISSNPMVASVKTVDGKPVVVEIEVDGKETLAFVLDFGLNNIQMAGKSSITAISKSTGKQGTTEVEVGPGLKVDKITLGTPAGTVKGNSTVLIPVEAVDTEGNEVKKLTLLDKLAKNENLNGSVNVSGTLKVGAEPKFVERNGKFYLEVKTDTVEDNARGMISATVTTATQKVATKTLQVQPDARPFAIVGLKDGVSNTILANNPEYTDYFNAKDFLVEDQYGDPMPRDTYTIKASLAEGQSGKGFTIGGETTNNNFANPTPKDSTKSFWIKANDYFVDGQNMNPSSATFTFELYDNEGKKVKDKLGQEVTTTPYVDIKFNATEVDAFASYEATSFDTIYLNESSKTTPADYQRTLTVYGVTDAGKKVQLPASAFKVKDEKNVTTVAVNNQYKLSATDAVDTVKETVKPDTADASLVVVINHTGEEILVEGKISAIKPVVETVDFLSSATHAPVSYIDAANVKVQASDLKLTAGHYAITIDQYGIRNYDTSVNFDSITFTNLESKTAVIKNNGTKDAYVDKLEKGDLVQAKVSVDGATKTILIKAKSEDKAEGAVANVKSQNELQLALNNGYTKINLAADFNAATATIDTGQSGNITITKDGEASENPAKLIVNAPNATVTVEQGDYQEATINDVSNNSFVIGENASVTSIVVNDNEARIVNNSTTAPTLSFNTAGKFALEGKFGSVTTTVTGDEKVVLNLGESTEIGENVSDNVEVNKPEAPIENTIEFTFSEGIDIADDAEFALADGLTGTVAQKDGEKSIYVVTFESSTEIPSDSFEITSGENTYTVKTTDSGVTWTATLKDEEEGTPEEK